MDRTFLMIELDFSFGISYLFFADEPEDRFRCRGGGEETLCTAGVLSSWELDGGAEPTCVWER